MPQSIEYDFPKTTPIDGYYILPEMGGCINAVNGSDVVSIRQIKFYQ